jgi:hypothetical protein
MKNNSYHSKHAIYDSIQNILHCPVMVRIAAGEERERHV